MNQTVNWDIRIQKQKHKIRLKERLSTFHTTWYINKNITQTKRFTPTRALTMHSMLGVNDASTYLFLSCIFVSICHCRDSY